MKEIHVSLKTLVLQKFPDLTDGDALASILSGQVYVDGELVTRHQTVVSTESQVEIRPGKKYVSRGGEKLQPVWDAWLLSAADKVFIDAGSSTGGFTDFLLKRGAKAIFAVDVGYNQLDYSLRQDPRVRVWERTNVMDLRMDRFDILPDAAVIDLSFRSIRSAASIILSLVREAWAVALVKPQFELQEPPEQFRGVVRDPVVLVEVLDRVVDTLWREHVYVSRVAPSPVPGRKGNREFFFLVRNRAEKTIDEIKAECRVSALK